MSASSPIAGAGRLLRRQGRRPPPRGDALGPDPYWAKDIKIGFSTINARAEEVDTKPAFREAFRQRRCLVPPDSFYEWKKIGTGKQPYAIALADRRLMGMAELWEIWRSPAGERICSFSIITTQPNELCAELHNRMPAVLKPEAWLVWLGEQPADVPQLKALLAPYPSDEMICWPVSARVPSTRGRHPERSIPRGHFRGHFNRRGREFDSRSRCEWAASKPLCPSGVSASWPSRTCYQMP
jgi:putative SOS response-associated peptidase YedK